MQGSSRDFIEFLQTKIGVSKPANFVEVWNETFRGLSHTGSLARETKTRRVIASVCFAASQAHAQGGHPIADLVEVEDLGPKRHLDQPY